MADPHTPENVPNPFGGMNSVLRVSATAKATRERAEQRQD
jgi:hypothetical protein